MKKRTGMTLEMNLLLCQEVATYSISVINSFRDGVIDLAEEIFFLVVISVLRQVQGEDTPVNHEHHREESQVVDPEPLVGALGGNGGETREHGWDGGRYGTINPFFIRSGDCAAMERDVSAAR